MRLGLAGLSLRKPSSKAVQQCADDGQRSGPNHLLSGASEEYEHSESRLSSSKLTDGWYEDYDAAKVGNGKQAFEAAKTALQSWQHMSLGWVETNRPPIKTGSGVCIAARMLCFWQRNPLEIVYVNQKRKPFWSRRLARPAHDYEAAYEFGQTTLDGHALAGEERFRVSLKQDGSVWYEIYAFSRARTILALAAFPVRRFYQQRFRRDSIAKMESVVGPQHAD